MRTNIFIRQLSLTAIIGGLLLTAALASCARNEVFDIVPQPSQTGNTVLPDGRIQYTLTADVPIAFDSTRTRTGSANEAAVNQDIWVMVFDAEGPKSANPTLMQIAKAFDHPATATDSTRSKRLVVLTPANHAVRIVVLANMPATIYDDDGTTNPRTLTELPASWGIAYNAFYNDVVTHIATVLLPVPTDVVPYTPNLRLPMSENYERTTLDVLTNLGTDATPLRLRRAVAKVTVKRDYTPSGSQPNFLIRGITARNVPRNGRLMAPIATANIRSNVGNLTNYIGIPNEVTDIAAAVGDITTLSNPLYVYESNEPVAANQPYFILQARYGGDATDTYYKLATTAINQQLLRNYHYEFCITGVATRGYATLAEAAVRPASNIIYTVTIQDLSSLDLTDNGQYALGVSNSEFHVYLNPGRDTLPNLETLVAFTLSTTQTTTAIGAIPPSGSLTASAGIHILSPTTFNHPAQDSVKIELTDAFFAAPNNGEGYIDATFGNLTKRVTVKRMGGYLLGLSSIQDNDLYVGGDYQHAVLEDPSLDWIKLSTQPIGDLSSGHSEIESPSGGIRINYLTTRPMPYRHADVYLFRKDGNGRVKAHFDLFPIVFKGSNGPPVIDKFGFIVNQAIGTDPNTYEFYSDNLGGFEYQVGLFPEGQDPNTHIYHGAESPDATALTTKSIDFATLDATSVDPAMFPMILEPWYNINGRWYLIGRDQYDLTQRPTLQIRIMIVGANGFVVPGVANIDKGTLPMTQGVNYRIGELLRNMLLSAGTPFAHFATGSLTEPYPLQIYTYNFGAAGRGDALWGGAAANIPRWDALIDTLEANFIDILYCPIHTGGTTGTNPDFVRTAANRHGPTRAQAQAIIDQWLSKNKYRGLWYTNDFGNNNQGWSQAIFDLPLDPVASEIGTANAGSEAERDRFHRVYSTNLDYVKIPANDPWYNHPVYEQIMSKGSYTTYTNYPAGAGNPILLGSNIVNGAMTANPVNMRTAASVFSASSSFGMIRKVDVDRAGFIPLMYFTAQAGTGYRVGETFVGFAVNPDKRIVMQGEIQMFTANDGTTQYLAANGSLAPQRDGPVGKLFANMFEWFFKNVAFGKQVGDDEP